MSLFNSTTSSAPNTSGQAPSSSLVPITVDDIKANVPAHLRSNVSQKIADDLNNINADPLVAEQIRNNFISYGGILKEGKFKLDEYLNAVAYVSFKIMGKTNADAYALTFPARYQRLVAAGTSQQAISSYVAAYNKGKLVNLILEQTLIPSWVLNQDLHQKAINKLADLMVSAASEKVQMESAIGLVNALGKPKEGNFQINIGETENAGMKEMRGMLEEMARVQRDGIAAGTMKTIDVAAQRIHKDED